MNSTSHNASNEVHTTNSSDKKLSAPAVLPSQETLNAMMWSPSAKAANEYFVGLRDVDGKMMKVYRPVAETFTAMVEYTELFGKIHTTFGDNELLSLSKVDSWGRGQAQWLHSKFENIAPHHILLKLTNPLTIQKLPRERATQGRKGRVSTHEYYASFRGHCRHNNVKCKKNSGLSQDNNQCTTTYLAGFTLQGLTTYAEAFAKHSKNSGSVLIPLEMKFLGSCVHPNEPTGELRGAKRDEKREEVSQV